MNTEAPMRSERVVGWLIRHRAAVLLVALVLGAIGAWRTVSTYAALRSDLEELLPESAPSVAALDMLRERLPSMRYLGVVVDTGGPHNVAAANRLIDDLSLRLEAYPPEMVGLVRRDVREERRFLETHALQLMDPKDVRELRKAVERRRDWEFARKADINLLTDEEDPRPEIPVARLREKYEDRYGKPRKLPEDRFVSEDGRTAVLVIQAASHATSYEADQALLSRVKQDIESLGFPHVYAPDMRVGFASDVATRVEELQGLFSDLAVSGAIVASLVVASLLWFFGSWRALPVLGVPLVLGTFYTFGLVALPPLSICHLNTNTAFLGSVIVGNGINSGIILLARFAEQRRRADGLEAAIATAVRATWRPTLAAALAASTAYGVLVFTDFRGFNQFGWIGGLGMITCWATTLVLAPPLLSLLGERLVRPGAGAPSAVSLQRALTWLLSRPRSVVAVTALLAVATAAGLVHRGTDWLEHDLSKLRRSDSFVSGERYWGKRMDATLQRYLTPTVVMVHDSEQAAGAEEHLRELQRQNRAGGLIGTVRSARELLPETREAALAEARRLRRVLTPRMKSELDADDRRMVDAATSDDALEPLRASEIPDGLAAGFREQDGRMDRTVLVFPKLTDGTWDGQLIKYFTDDLRQSVHAADPLARVAGSLPLSSDITTAMKQDGPRATALGLLAALVICALAFGSLRLSMAAIASLLVGVVLMMGGLGWTTARLNFANFVVLPITFGISADYAINVLRRYQAEGRMSARNALASTGGAVAMCSATTIIGFGSLLAAKNQALFSFGVFAVAGEVTMLATAALALPAVLALRERAAETVRLERARPGAGP